MENYYNDIPVGKGNAITREDLSIKWKICDRGVRKIISELRAQDFGDDYIIVSTSSGKGYYKTDNIEDILNFKREIMNRGRHTFKPLRKVNRVLSGKVEPVNQFKACRNQKGITNRQAVEYVQRYDPAFDRYTLSKIENGKCGATNQQLALLAELYETTPEELAGLIIT